MTSTSLGDMPYTQYTLPYRWGNIPSVVPFTYVDGETNMSILRRFNEYLMGLVPEIQQWGTAAFEEMQKNIDALGLDQAQTMEAYRQEINVLVDEINNRVGPAEVQHVLLTADTTLAIPVGVPDNHMLFYEVTQDATGGHSLAFPPNVSGSVVIARGGGEVTRFALTPDGKGGWGVDTTYLRADETDVLLAPVVASIDNTQRAVSDVSANVASVVGELDSVKDRAASVEELTDTVSFWYQGSGNTSFDYNANLTGFIAPFPLRILSIDIVFEQCNIPQNAANYITLFVRRATNGGAGGANTFVSKSTASGTGEAIVARKTWGMAGGTWVPQYQIFSKGDAVNFAFNFTGSGNTISLPMQATIRYMPL